MPGLTDTTPAPADGDVVVADGTGEVTPAHHAAQPALVAEMNEAPPQPNIEALAALQ